MLKWIAALLFAPSLAFAQDCNDPQTQNEMNACAQLEWEEADRKLNDAYKLARSAMRQLDSDLPSDMVGAEIALRDAQRAWITFRDAACEAEGFQFRGGSMEPLIVITCMSNLTQRRTGDLLGLTEY